MSKRTQKLNRIVSLAEAEERRHGQITGKSQAMLNDQVERLGELNAHRQSYAAKAQDVADIHSAHWKDYQNFLYRLDKAVRSQQGVISECEQTVESHRRRWMAKRQRLESLNRVLERYEKEEHVLAERREQKVLDDLQARPDLYEE